MSATGLQPENIVFRLLLKLGGRLAHCEDGYGKISISEGNIDIIRKEQSMRWAEFKERMLVHTLQYLNLRKFLKNGGQS